MGDPELKQETIDEFVGNAHGNFARVEELLGQYPALLNARATWNETAIQAAAQTGQVEIANLLLTAGAPMDICAAAMLGLKERVTMFLEADPGQANARGAHGIPVLYHAVIWNHRDIAELLLARGADVNLDEGGNPALHGAVLFDQVEMARWLLDHRARVNAPNYEGKTPLRVAVEKKREALAALLRQRGGQEKKEPPRPG